MLALIKTKNKKKQTVSAKINDQNQAYVILKAHNVLVRNAKQYQNHRSIFQIQTLA